MSARDSWGPPDASPEEQTEEMRELRALLCKVVDDDSRGFDSDKLWGRIAPKLESPPSLADRVRTWLRPGILVPVTAAVAAGVLGVVIPAKVDPPKPDPVTMATVDSRCFVDEVQAGEGNSVLIGRTADEQAATVIWLLANSEEDSP